jgi:hypothetical protein
MLRRPEGRYEWVLLIILSSGLVVTALDIAKKTIFINARWNYHYPEFSFIYDTSATILLICLSAAVVVTVPYLLEIERWNFVAMTFLSALALYWLSFFALPEKSAFHALRPDKAMYCASVEVVKNGIVTYFENFHTIDHCPERTGFIPSSSRVSYIQSGSIRLEQWISGAKWFPLHREWASYAATIGEQKHGPIPPLLAAGGLVLFGVTPFSAVVMNYLMAALLAPIAYFSLSELFEEEYSRVTTLIFMFVPAIFIYVRKHVIAYDTYTAVFAFTTVALFIRAVTRRSYGYAAAAGVVYSMAFLSKVTAIPIIFVLLIAAFSSDAMIADSIKRVAIFSATALAFPISLIIVGYNFIIQYLFQFALHANLNKGGLLLAQKPNPDLGHPLLNLMAALYQFRLFSIPLLFLLGAFVVWTVMNWSRVVIEHRYHYGLIFLIPIVSFSLWKLGLNLGRQLLPYFIGIALLAVSGLRMIMIGESRSRRLLLYRVSITVTATVSLINL